jgi:hypothetical protein
VLIVVLCGLLLPVGAVLGIAIADDEPSPPESPTLPSPSSSEPLPSPSASEPPPSPSASESPSTSSPYTAGGCTRVIGYSVTNDWWSAGFEQRSGVDAGAWEGVFVFGEMLPVWADPSFPGWIGDVKGGIQSAACGETPSRLVIQIADLGFEQASDDEMLDLLLRVIDNARSHYPGLERIDLIPIVGGPDHEECPGVLATRMHPRMDAIISSAVDDELVFAGPDLVVDSCADFRDATGHLSSSGAAHVADLMAAYVGS